MDATRSPMCRAGARGEANLIFMLNWTNSPLKSFCHLARIDNGSKQKIQWQTRALGHTPAVPPTHLTRMEKEISRKMEN